MRSRRALVVGASGALGGALVERLRTTSGWSEVVTASRSTDGLDLRDEDSVVAWASGLGGPFDLVFDATGILAVDGVDPERSFRHLDPVVMARSFAVNAIGPAMLFKHLADKLPRAERSVFATLSARIGSIGDNGLGGWMSYRASKAALNQIVRCAAIEIGRKRKQAIVVALHPGTVPSALTGDYARGRYTATAAESAGQLLGVMEGLTPRESGAFLAYDGSLIPW